MQGRYSTSGKLLFQNVSNTHTREQAARQRTETFSKSSYSHRTFSQRHDHGDFPTLYCICKTDLGLLISFFLLSCLLPPRARARACGCLWLHLASCSWWLVAWPPADLGRTSQPTTLASEKNHTSILPRLSRAHHLGGWEHGFLLLLLNATSAKATTARAA